MSVNKNIFFAHLKTPLLAILCGVLFFFSTNKIVAQTLTTSPYSRYGIGDITQTNSAQSQAMGGIEQALRLPFGINYNNPSSYSAIELSTFQAGVKLSYLKQSTNTQTQKTKNGYLSSIAFGIPLKKGWGMSFGLLPYSGVGYKVNQEKVLDNIGQVYYISNGSGGLNRVYVGTGISPFVNKADSSWLKGFSIGANASYIFGNIEYENRVIFPDGPTTFYHNLREVNVTTLGDFYFDYGLQYRSKLKRDWWLTIGATAAAQTKLNASNSYLAQTFTIANGYEYGADTVLINNDSKGKIVLPTTWGLGAMLKKTEKIQFGIDYKTQAWSKFSSFGKSDSLSNSSSFSLGGQFIPNPKSLAFLPNIHYRAGVNYTSTYLNIHSHQLTQQSINFGAGFPLFRSKSFINVAFQYGTRGTLQDNLIKENFYSINIGFSFCDRWFIKRKFD